MSRARALPGTRPKTFAATLSLANRLQPVRFLQHIEGPTQTCAQCGLCLKFPSGWFSWFFIKFFKCINICRAKQLALSINHYLMPTEQELGETYSHWPTEKLKEVISNKVDYTES